MIREEDLADLEELLKNLQARVDECHKDGRVYLMSQLVNDPKSEQVLTRRVSS